MTIFQTSDLRFPIALSLLLLCAADAPSTQSSLTDRVGQPLKIVGTTVDGTEFSTDQLKGKVVLVDFWATWCVPCVAELPKVKSLKEQYHGKGLEIVGVSSDFKKPLLIKFLAAHPEYNWPQLFDAKSAKDEELHPAAKALGIQSLPAILLIDKKGVCRSVHALEDAQQMIPKLLAE